MATTGQGLLGNNMFAYCNNNPVMMSDPSGNIAITTAILIGSIVVGVVSAGITAYQTYQAGWDTEDILWYTFGAGLSGFLTIYTLGMSAYEMYITYCHLHSITPITDISFSNNTVAVYGSDHAPKQGISNSTYNRVDEDGSTITSITQYNSSGKPVCRTDYYCGTNPHQHYSKAAQMYLYDHVHVFSYNEAGKVNGKYVTRL